ncbi:type II toxin-antitoxin system Phd/YefM family antitoxin [Pseudacidovorax intermedius]|uniref:Antitoxin n=1 Tax=Pseudacidovorax intermedius TaxID=433924 RepID=A0A147GLT4_9BURK|nr:antitoxin [Pseudacidovorax intermedius]KTT14557.1 antitoxin [Pseudacidovorax intermedius]
MPRPLLADAVASISELKADPIKVVASGAGMPVAVIDHGKPIFYCVPAATYEAMMDLLDDAELLVLVKTRQHEASVRMSLKNL